MKLGRSARGGCQQLVHKVGRARLTAVNDAVRAMLPRADSIVSVDEAKEYLGGLGGNCRRDEDVGRGVSEVDGEQYRRAVSQDRPTWRAARDFHGAYSLSHTVLPFVRVPHVLVFLISRSRVDIHLAACSDTERCNELA